MSAVDSIEEQNKDVTPSETLKDRIEVTIKERINPLLASHGGYISLHSIDGDVVRVSFMGACKGCPSMQISFDEIVVQVLETEYPNEIKEVRIYDEMTREMLEFAKKIMHQTDK